ncbi:hypothetical protein Tco_1151122 [Tanacetum coccineum]
MQKAKIQWAIEGDENSKFFHGIINRKRANLAIKGVMVDGDWVDDPCRVKEEFRLHFANRFRAPVDTRYKLNYTFPNKLQPDQMATLESPVSRDEVRNTVWGCGENKSPGPDGFSFEFFRKFWDTVGSDFYEAGAFLPNRQILDDPFIINELLSWCKHKKQQAMVFKVDFAKAYDSIRWDFPKDVLTAFGFGPKWLLVILVVFILLEVGLKFAINRPKEYVEGTILSSLEDRWVWDSNWGRCLSHSLLLLRVKEFEICADKT